MYLNAYKLCSPVFLSCRTITCWCIWMRSAQSICIRWTRRTITCWCIWISTNLYSFYRCNSRTITYWCIWIGWQAMILMFKWHSGSISVLLRYNNDKWKNLYFQGAWTFVIIYSILFSSWSLMKNLTKKEAVLLKVKFNDVRIRLCVWLLVV